VPQTWFGRLTSSYDARGSLTGLSDPQGGRATWVFDAAGQLIEQDNPDGTVTTWSYDRAGQVTGTRHKDKTGAVLDQAYLTYDPVGNPLTKNTLDGVHTMSYDAANQLRSEYHPLAGVKTWAYDLAGNRPSQDWTQVGVRTLTNWAYDGADQLTTETTGTAVTTYTFDGAGNEQVVQTPTVRTTFTWDGANRLVGIQMQSGARNTMSYRADGLRHRLVDSEGDKQMVWDSQGSSGYGDLLQERLP
jgi:YD repeat-containing protein